MNLIRDLYAKLKAKIMPTHRPAKEVDLRSTVRQHDATKSEYGKEESHGRTARLNSWCHRFMSRNHGIVPEKSPESIFYKTQRPRRRRS